MNFSQWWSSHKLKCSPPMVPSKRRILPKMAANIQEEKLRKGPWLEEEDEQLIAIVSHLGQQRWDSIARASGLRRSGKSCRLRWLNYLRPNLKHGPISPEEEQIILQLHERWGNKWSRIARRLPGRTDNGIKNYWRALLRKKTLVQEQGNYHDTSVSDAKRCSSAQEGSMHASEANNEDSLSVLDKMGVTDECSSSISRGLPNYAFATSPYETRLSNWLSGLSEDQSGIDHPEHCDISFYSNFAYPSWSMSDDGGNTSLWECSGSIWDLD